ncbi:unnamed protein product [Hapterophycus canaliculatus]
MFPTAAARATPGTRFAAVAVCRQMLRRQNGGTSSRGLGVWHVGRVIKGASACVRGDKNGALNLVPRPYTTAGHAERGLSVRGIHASCCHERFLVRKVVLVWATVKSRTACNKGLRGTRDCASTMNRRALRAGRELPTFSGRRDETIVGERPKLLPCLG